MANTKKGIFYPSIESEIPSFYDNAEKQLNLFKVKYGTSPTVMTAITGYKNQMPLAKMKSDADQQMAKASVQAKNDLFALAKLEIMRELKRITDLPNFAEADAMQLGIRKQNNEQMKQSEHPLISAITVMPDQVVIDWIKGIMDGVAVYGSADGVHFELLGIDLRSPYEDKRKNKVDGVPEIRYYKLRYLKGDVQVGQFSDVVNVTVLI
jgi:hypothetical protein